MLGSTQENLVFRFYQSETSFATSRHLGGRDETSPPEISPASRRRRGPPDSAADRESASLSDTAGADHRWLCGWRPGRHRRPPHRSLAVGAAWTAIRDREPAGRRYQPRHRGLRARPRRRLHVALGRYFTGDQRDALQEAEFPFHP